MSRRLEPIGEHWGRNLDHSLSTVVGAGKLAPDVLQRARVRADPHRRRGARGGAG
jgi:hypothetical protein